VSTSRLVSGSIAYLNGDFVPAAEARLPIYDFAVIQGATVSEMARTFHRRLFRLDDHLDRLFASLGTIGLDSGLSRDEWTRLSLDLVSRNAAEVAGHAELALVHFVSAGENAMYAGHPVRPGPTVCAHTFPLDLSRWADKLVDGVHVVTPATRQVPAECWSPSVKCRSRMHYYLAEREAKQIDPDAVALLLDLAGHLTETNGANFLLVDGGKLVSPCLSQTLPGVSRRVVIDLASAMSLGLVERNLTPLDAVRVDEALLTGTPYCLLPVTRINGAPLGGGKPGPVFQQLLAAFSREVGVDIAEQIRSSRPAPDG
jgi:branched-chain amino acid aminotransferase